MQVSAIVLDVLKNFADKNSSRQTYTLVEQRVEFFALFVELLEQILVQERIQLPQDRLLQTVGMLTEVLTVGYSEDNKIS